MPTPARRPRIKRGTRSRQAALWLLATGLLMVFLWNTLPDALHDDGPTAQAMRRDASALGSAAWNHFGHTGQRVVTFGYDPATGAISGPLAEWVGRISKGYSVDDSTIEDNTLPSFTLSHPDAFAGTRVGFDSHGQLLTRGQPAKVPRRIFY